MAVHRWSEVALKGLDQVIPRICPNCLKPATVDLRYAYINPWSRLSPTKHFQTFRYCHACGEAAQAHAAHERRTGWMYRFPGVLVLLAPSGVLAGFLADFLTRQGIIELKHGLSPSAVAILLGTLMLGPAIGWLLERWFLKRAKQRHPKTNDQACWGIAAYYAGNGFFGVGSQMYLAARPEWIRALVEANPDQTSDELYRQWTGTDRPLPRPEHPFAG